MANKITIYTDGSCKNNGQANAKGGWAAILNNGDNQLSISAGALGTTNQQMELQAVIEGLKAVRNHVAVITVFTDSKYVQRGCSEWLEIWKAKGWRLSSGKPMQNIDRWQALDELLSKLNVAVKWVKGHSGDRMNDLADRLASEAVGQPLRRKYAKSFNYTL